MQTSCPVPETLALHLAEQGAVFTVWNSPARHFLIGEFAWLDPNHVFWFNANGSDEEDAQVLEFDAAEVTRGEVRFRRDGRIVGAISAIDAAAVEDRDDYRIAWTIWEQVAPTRARLIESLREKYE